MKPTHAVLAACLGLAAVLALALLSRRADETAAAVPSVHEAKVREVPRIVASREETHHLSPVEGGEMRPGRAEGLARAAQQDAIAATRRRALLERNLDSLEQAIAKAEEDGGNSEYVAALRKRMELLLEQTE